MCSLLSVFTSRQFSSEFIKSADMLLQKSRRRGPDDSGSVFFDNQIYLGSNRLQIIGSPGHGRMPFQSQNAECWIVFNGEIYNHKELRVELQAKGLRFKTDSDIEVIVNSYIAWGLDFVKRLNGIFSFVIYDGDNKKIIAARDRFGAKPLYYFLRDDLLTFSSDFQTVCTIAASDAPLRIRNDALSTFMMLRFVPGDATIYDTVFKVNPAECICADLQKVGSLKKHTYWKPSIEPKAFDQDEFNTKLCSAILRTATADVPSGILLSGGLDSSSILAILKNDNQTVFSTYSCSFEGAEPPDDQPYNTNKITTANIAETQLAAEVATQFNVGNERYSLNLNCGIQTFISMQKAFGEPMGSPNALGLFLLADSIKTNVAPKTFLSGTGADELLGGYQQLYFKDSEDLGNVTIDELFRSFCDFDSSSDNILGFLDPNFVDDSYLNKSLQKCMEAINGIADPKERLNQLAVFEFNFALPFWEMDQADKLFMHYSFELRPSFLENDFVDYCFTIKSCDKINKQPLRQSMQGILPSRIVERAKMPSLSTPKSIIHSEWFRLLLNDVKEDPCSFWNKEKLSQFFNRPDEEQSFDLLYRIIYLQSWFKNIHNNNPVSLNILA